MVKEVQTSAHFGGTRAVSGLAWRGVKRRIVE
jgi:hypothetical protein